MISPIHKIMSLPKLFIKHLIIVSVSFIITNYQYKSITSVHKLTSHYNISSNDETL